MAKSNRVIPVGKTQENFNIDKSLLESVKDLAYSLNTSRAEVYHAAIEKYIQLYEKKNGKLKPRPKGKGLSI
jgi:hypothetical protein